MSDYDKVLADGSMTPDEKADAIIATMVTGAVALAIIPAHVNWALFASLLGGGVVAIGTVYGVSLSKDEAWKLVRMFFSAAGWTFLGLAVGGKILAAILTSTGIGHIGAVALDSAISAALAYSVGSAGKAYFKGEHDRARLGQIFRDSFRRKRAELSEGN
jgi:uncharacterized protein (DUF697 family)